MNHDSFFLHLISQYCKALLNHCHRVQTRGVCHQRGDVFFHLSQVSAILHSKLQLKCKDQGLKGSFISPLLHCTQWKVK